MNEPFDSHRFVVESIAASFPEEGDELVRWGRDLYCFQEGDDPQDLPWAPMLGRFADLTNDLIQAGDLEHAKEHLDAVASLLALGAAEVRDAIDVSYAENLMWNVDDPKKRRAGWAIVPAELQDLYEAMWGPFREIRTWTLH
jgi:hypothetical protein